MGGCSCRDISVLKEPGKAWEPAGHTLPPPPAAPPQLQMMLFAGDPGWNSLAAPEDGGPGPASPLSSAPPSSDSRAPSQVKISGFWLGLIFTSCSCNLPRELFSAHGSSHHSASSAPSEQQAEPGLALSAWEGRNLKSGSSGCPQCHRSGSTRSPTVEGAS